MPVHLDDPIALMLVAAAALEGSGTEETPAHDIRGRFATLSRSGSGYPS
jgi:hypothetical protein